MNKEIRKILEDKVVSNKKLSESHRAEFITKLKASRSTAKNSQQFIIYRVAAVIVVLITMGYFTYNLTRIQEPKVSQSQTMIAQMETIEREFLKNIDTEWQNFLMLAKDEKLVKRFEQRLDNLDKDYQEVSQQFKENSNNILIIENLVENLQTRLQLLKDIQEHITILNKQNQDYEII